MAPITTGLFHIQGPADLSVAAPAGRVPPDVTHLWGVCPAERPQRRGLPLPHHAHAPWVHRHSGGFPGQGGRSLTPPDSKRVLWKVEFKAYSKHYDLLNKTADDQPWLYKITFIPQVEGRWKRRIWWWSWHWSKSSSRATRSDVLLKRCWTKWQHRLAKGISHSTYMIHGLYHKYKLHTVFTFQM